MNEGRRGLRLPRRARPPDRPALLTLPCKSFGLSPTGPRSASTSIVPTRETPDPPASHHRRKPPDAEANPPCPHPRRIVRQRPHRVQHSGHVRSFGRRAVGCGAVDTGVIGGPIGGRPVGGAERFLRVRRRRALGRGAAHDAPVREAGASSRPGGHGPAGTRGSSDRISAAALQCACNPAVLVTVGACNAASRMLPPAPASSGGRTLQKTRRSGTRAGEEGAPNRPSGDAALGETTTSTAPHLSVRDDVGVAWTPARRPSSERTAPRRFGCQTAATRIAPTVVGPAP